LAYKESTSVARKKRNYKNERKRRVDDVLRMAVQLRVRKGRDKKREKGKKKF